MIAGVPTVKFGWRNEDGHLEKLTSFPTTTLPDTAKATGAHWVRNDHQIHRWSARLTRTSILPVASILRVLFLGFCTNKFANPVVGIFSLTKRMPCISPWRKQMKSSLMSSNRFLLPLPIPLLVNLIYLPTKIMKEKGNGKATSQHVHEVHYSLSLRLHCFHFLLFWCFFAAAGSLPFFGFFL